MEIAFNLLVPVFLGFFIGQHFDNASHKAFPLWTIIGVFVGMLTGMWSIYKKYIM